jgi:vacuolar-type H+-ATPase subunit I/STV1
MIKLTLLFSSLIIFTACNNKQLPTKNSDYNGLYNALTIDYAQQNKNLENNLSYEENKSIELNKNKIQLDANINSVKNKLRHREESLNNDKKSISEIKNELKKMDALIKTEAPLREIDKKIIKIHQSIK